MTEPYIVSKWFFSDMSLFRSGQLSRMTDTMIEILEHEVRDLGATAGAVRVVITFERGVPIPGEPGHSEFVACCMLDAEVVRVCGEVVAHPPL